MKEEAFGILKHWIPILKSSQPGTTFNLSSDNVILKIHIREHIIEWGILIHLEDSWKACKAGKEKWNLQSGIDLQKLSSQSLWTKRLYEWEKWQVELKT